ncbi:hypothetical protein [Kamptonema formosum]|uniref:hypothetical protein n=1 Tax=Kamptonema formosum TaxID=331992 RepID=UPI00034533FB|nr:hypothetical protein [Oscillatoria sp. PCC 10802]
MTLNPAVIPTTVTLGAEAAGLKAERVGCCPLDLECPFFMPNGQERRRNRQAKGRSASPQPLAGVGAKGF